MSKLIRRVGIFAMVLLLASSVGVPMTVQAQAIALEHPPIMIAPLWENVSSAQVAISASGTTLRPGLAVVARNNSQIISGTLFLERQSGNSWVRVTSWAVSGTGRLTENRTWTGTTGGTYRARIVVTAGVDRIERISTTVRI